MNKNNYNWRRPEWLPETLFPFDDQFMDIGGNRVHYIDEGKGKTLLFLHGNPAWSFLFRKVIPQLSDRYRCIALDYPGFGFSVPERGYDFLPLSHTQVLTAFIHDLELKDITLVVSDWGGPIGLSYAVNHPENIRSLVIGNTFAWPVDDDFHFVAFSRFFGGSIGKFLIRRFNLFVNMLIPLGTRKAKLTPAEMAAYRNPFPTPERRFPTSIFPREIVNSSPFLDNLWQKFGVLSETPTLLLWGEKDIAFRDKELARFQSALKNQITHKLADAGHFLWEDEPDLIAKHIRNFMEASAR